MDKLERAMLLARTSRQLPAAAVQNVGPITPPAPVLTEAEATNRILIERVKHLEAAMALVLNELGIKVAAPGKPQVFPSVRQCIVATAQHFGVGVHDILGHSHKAFYSHIRHVAMYVAKQLTLATYPMLGRTFDGRDHTTVMHGVRKIELNRRADAQLDRDINHISQEVLKKHAPPGALEAAPPVPSPVAEGAASLPR